MEEEDRKQKAEKRRNKVLADLKKGHIYIGKISKDKTFISYQGITITIDGYSGFMQGWDYKDYKYEQDESVKFEIKENIKSHKYYAINVRPASEE